MNELTPDFVKAINNQNNDGEVILMLLSFTDSDGYFSSFVNDNNYITSQGVTYYPRAFQLSQPNEKDDGNQQSSLNIDNSDGYLTVSALDADLSNPVAVYSCLIMASAPDDQVLGTTRYATSWVLTNTQVQLTLQDDLTFTEGIPAWTFNPSTNPGLFAIGDPTSSSSGDGSGPGPGMGDG